MNSDPYVKYEETDPATGERKSWGITQQSIIQALIAAGQPFRIIAVINPEPPVSPQDTQG